MITDLYKDIKIQLYERATSPLLGSFVISWCLWNYKLFLVMFSSAKALDKIKHIEFVLYPNFWWDGALFTLIGPLITTFAFIFIYPIPALYIFEYTRKQQAKLKEVQQKIEDETPLTHEESRKIRSVQRLLRSQHDEKITEKEKEIENHNATIKELNLGLDAAEIRSVEAEARAKKAEAELSRLQSQIKKPAQTKSEITNKSENKSNDIRSWKEILGELVNLTGERKENATKLMKELLVELNSGPITKDYFNTKYKKYNDIQDYVINTLKETDLIHLSVGKYRLTINGTKFVVERLLDTK